jgi:hypothetical protein
MLPPFLQEPDRPDNDAINVKLRNIRAEFIRVLHTGRRFDEKGKAPSMAPALMRNVMEMASRNGLSPEEALLVLSYEALQTIERMAEQLLEYGLHQPHPRLMTSLNHGLR